MKGATYLKVLQGLTYRRAPHEVFRSFVLLAACAVSCGQREADYMAEAKRWEPKELHAFSEALGLLITDMDGRWFEDLLGPVHMEWGSKSAQQSGGEFYTPKDVSRAIARMTLTADSFPVGRPATVLEPACGSGGMVLALAEHVSDLGLSPRNMRVTCIDVSSLACDMCFLNLTLWGIPAEVIYGNALSGETWAAWRNPWWWQAWGREGSSTSEPEDAPRLQFATDARGQFSFDLGQLVGAA
jgi:type I restriction-modification system DNA methylase subunit